jgi:hypothetical protein
MTWLSFLITFSLLSIEHEAETTSSASNEVQYTLSTTRIIVRVSLLFRILLFIDCSIDLFNSSQQIEFMFLEWIVHTVKFSVKADDYQVQGRSRMSARVIRFPFSPSDSLISPEIN